MASTPVEGATLVARAIRNANLGDSRECQPDSRESLEFPIRMPDSHEIRTFIRRFAGHLLLECHAFCFCLLGPYLK